MARQAIFITGGGSGIGRATARHFAKQGWFVGIADVNRAGIDETAALLPDGASSRHLMDVRDRDQWQAALAEFAKASGGRLDVLFNNAGIGSGGQFIDMAVHDIDLARWFMASDPKTIFAIGGCYAHPEFGQFKDGDNVSALMHLQNDSMAFLFAGRTAPHGYNVETEIVGTKGTLRIASVPQKNMVEILDEHGVRKECSQDFIERFGEAYLNEMNEFISCINEGRKPEVTVYDGTKCTEIAYKCKEAFESNELVRM